jgi:hypothetical protein
MMTVEDASRAHLDRIHDNFQSQAESAAPELSDGPPARGDQLGPDRQACSAEQVG